MYNLYLVLLFNTDFIFYYTSYQMKIATFL